MTYIQQLLRVIVAQICQTIGWHSIQTTPLELLVDILHKYLQEITRETYRYTELYNRTEPNLDDIALCFRDLNINISEIEEYINYVQPINCPIDVPKFPVHKDSNLNFLKPGSNEVLTRPVHINEYLPPIYPEKEIKQQLTEHDLYNDPEITCDTKNSTISNGKLQQNSDNDDTIFKKPELQDSLTTNLNGNMTMSSISLLASSSGLTPANFNGNKKTRLFEEEGRPTREMSSVMMTSSGFISPAREGKLPDSKPPILQEYRPVRTPSPKLTSNITSSINNGNLDNNPSTSTISVLGNTNSGPNNLTSLSSSPAIPTPTTSSHLSNQNNKKHLNNLDAKLLKKLKKKSNNIDKEQRKRDKLSGKLLSLSSTTSSSSTTTKPLSKNKLLKQLQKQQLQQQQLKSKYNINKDKLTKKQKQKLKQQRDFNMEHHNNIIKNLTSLQQNNKNNLMYQNNNNNMKDAITLLQQSAAIAAATGIPLADIHQPSASHQQQQFLLKQQQNFPLQHQQNLLSSTNNRINPDIKLSTEPDKNKLNIFKKISSSGVKKEHKDDIKSTMTQNYTNEQQLISLPSGTTITPTNIQSNINNGNNSTILPINNDKKYPLINNSEPVICLDDEEKLNLSTPSTGLQLQDIQSKNNGNSENNRSSSQQQQFNLTKSQTKIPKKLKKKYLQMDEQPLNLSNDKPLFNNNIPNIENLSFKQQLKMLNTKNMENYLKQQHQQISGKQTIKEKKERIKKNKIKENKINKNATTSSTVAQQFLQAVTAAAAAASATSGNSSGNHLLYPPDIRSTDNLAAINKKLMKIDTVMQPAPTINKLLSPNTIKDDLNNINKMNTQKSSMPSTSSANVNPAAVAAANFFSKQYLSGGPMGSYIPQLFPFPLFQPRPGLIPTGGLFPPLPPPPQQQSITSSNITGQTGFNEFLPMNMNFPISNNNLIGNNLNIDNKIDNLSSSTSLNSNNNKNMNNYLDNKNDMNLSNKILPSIPQFLENKNYSNVAPLVPESMIQNYQLTKTKQSKLNKQQQHQTFIPNLLPPQSSTSLATNLDYLDKNYNQSTIPLRKFQNDDLPIEISDDEKIKSDDDNQQQIKNNLNTEQLLLKSEELNNEQHKSFMNTNQQSQYQIDNKNSFNDNDKKINYNNKNINENRSIEINNDLFSSDHDGGNTDYNIGGDSGGGSTSINNKLDKQQRKEHKKGKKIKEGKIKKKKDKKDKTKNKEKYDKKQRMKDELNYTIRKDKEKSKKLKKEKKKDKQRLITANPLLTQETQLLDDFSHKSQLTDLTKISNNDNNGDESSAGDNTPQSGATTSSSTSSSSAVPKLTLKLGIGKSPTPDSIESRKIIIKSTGNDQQQLMIGSGFTDYNYRRDPSPELARISPLVTRPPKQKSKEKDKSGEIESPSSTTANIPSAISSGHYFPNISGNPTNTTAGNISNIPSISGNISIPSQLPQSMHSNPVVSRGPGRPKGSGNKNPSNIHNQPHPIGGIGGIGSTIVSGLDLNEQQSSNIIHPPIPSSTVHQPTMLLNTTDADGNQVWICPACGRVDDGTPMIGCDGCDAWYHWVCVGIQVPPDDNEDWYCRVCITKKQDVYESDKKKKRKKKNKTN